MIPSFEAKGRLEMLDRTPLLLIHIQEVIESVFQL